MKAAENTHPTWHVVDGVAWLPAVYPVTQSLHGGVHVSAAVKVHAPAFAQVVWSVFAAAQAETTVVTHVFGDPEVKVHAPALSHVV